MKNDLQLGLGAPMSAAKRRRPEDSDEEPEESDEEADEEDGSRSAAGKPVLAQEQYLDPKEAMAQMRALWGSSSREALETLIGAKVRAPGVASASRRSSRMSDAGEYDSAEEDLDMRDREVEEDENEGYKLFFLEVVGVPPPRFRPAQEVGGTIAEHPQNVYLSKVLGLANKIRSLGAPVDPAEAQAALLGTPAGGGVVALTPSTPHSLRNDLLRLWLEMQHEVNCYVDSSKAGAGGGAVLAPPGIRQLLERKEGLFRKHMMGKRVDYCCRSVISPDPFLGSGEVGLPVRFAKTLCFPEAVTPHNVEMLRAMVERGADEWPARRAGDSRWFLRVVSRRCRAKTIDTILESHGPCESFERSIVRIGLET